MNSVEDYRHIIIDDLKKLKTFKKCWKIWSPILNQKTQNFTCNQSIFNLGNDLSDIFFSTTEKGRGQSTVSAAGTAWESLICLYLNIVFSGSRAIATKQKKRLLPQCILDASTINYSNYQTNTESDIVVIVFPENFSFENIKNVKDLNKKIESSISKFEIGIIQCKTNWNDNSQIPMLWDMVYRSKGFKDQNISIGRNGHSIQDLKNFTYSFATVPTVKTPFKKDTMAVKRVRLLSGGNYWGKKSDSGIAFNINEIFNRNFKEAFDGSVLDSINNAIENKKGIFGEITLDN